MFSLVLTLLLLLEARTTRNLGRRADVRLYPRLYGPSGLYLSLRVKNFGPANATRCSVWYRLAGANGRSIVEQEHEFPIVAATEHITFLPFTVLPADEPAVTLPDMAERDIRLSTKWSWTDDRRRLWFVPTRQGAEQSWSTRALSEELYAGGSTERELDMNEQLDRIGGELKASREAIAQIESSLRTLIGLCRQPSAAARAQTQPNRRGWANAALARLVSRLRRGDS